LRKIILLVLVLLTIPAITLAAATPEPTKNVILFYRVPDAVIQCQNSSEDMVKGAQELEKELTNHYGKRFIVQGIQRVKQDNLSPADYQNMVKYHQSPFIIQIELKGQGQSVSYYQNAFGAQSTGFAPSTNVHLIEIIPNTNDNRFYQYDYGVQSYSAGTFAIGRDIYAAQKDPRKNAKNAIRGCFRDACIFDGSINKYANQAAYEKEINRFTGNFKPLSLGIEKTKTETNDKIEKFMTWCNADSSRKAYLVPLEMYSDSNLKIIYIDQFIKMGVYKE